MRDRLGPYTNDVFQKEKKHYITLFVVADYDSGVLELKEPEKCENGKENNVRWSNRR